MRKKNVSQVEQIDCLSVKEIDPLGVLNAWCVTGEISVSQQKKLMSIKDENWSLKGYLRELEEQTLTSSPKQAPRRT